MQPPLPHMPPEPDSPTGRADEVLQVHVEDAAVVERYWSKVRCSDEDDCWYWTGAISAKGHGRFWLAEGRVVIAHRFGYALAYPGEPLPPVVAHECDNPLCQSPHPGHMHPSTPGDNRREWAERRWRIGGPLRDSRGARGRAQALREAVRTGANLAEAAAGGAPTLDQDMLW